MARILLKEDLAAYRQTFLAYSTIGPLLTLGVGQGIYYFLPGEKHRIRGRVMDALAVLGLTGLLFAIFLICGGNELLAQRFSNPKVARFLLWLIPFVVLSLPSNIGSSVFVATENVMLASVFGVARRLLVGVATIVPLVIWKTCEAALLGNIVASCMLAVVSISLMIRCTPADSSLPSFSAARELVTFTLPLALGTMIGTISIQLDKLIVSFMCTPDEFAVYSIGAIQLPIIGILTGAITSVTLAEMRNHVVDGKRTEALKLFRLTAQKSSLLILPAMFFFLLTADSFIQLLFTVDYSESAVPFRWYLVLLPLRTVVFGSLIISLGRNDFILFRSAVNLVLNLLLSMAMVWFFGPWGAVVATITVIYTWSLPANLYVLSRELETEWHKLLPFKHFAATSIHLLPISLVGLGVVLFVESHLLQFSLVLAIFTVFLIWYWEDKLFKREEVLQKLRLGWSATWRS